MVIIVYMMLLTIAPASNEQRLRSVVFFFFCFQFKKIGREKRKMQANRVHKVKIHKKCTSNSIANCRIVRHWYKFALVLLCSRHSCSHIFSGSYLGLFFCTNPILFHSNVNITKFSIDLTYFCRFFFFTFSW